MLGLYQGGRSVVERQRQRRMEGGTIFRKTHVGTAAEQAVLDRRDGLFPDRLSRPDRIGAAGKGRARADRTPRRHDHPVLRQWPDGSGAEGPQRARGEPALQCPACQRVRRPRALLDLPHSRDRGLRIACRSRRSGKRSCSTASERPIRRSASPASSGRRPTSRSSSSSCRTRCRPIRMPTPSHRIGEERYLVSMFVDMRGSTKLAEHRLPFDTVFIVNRFLGAVSQAVIECGGQPNQFVGDGELALFGLTTSPQIACRQALRAAAMIAANVDELNQISRTRSARADPLRHRHSWRRSDHRRHRLPRPHGVHRARRRRQCRRHGCRT